MQKSSAWEPAATDSNLAWVAETTAGASISSKTVLDSSQLSRNQEIGLPFRTSTVCLVFALLWMALLNPGNQATAQRVLASAANPGVSSSERRIEQILGKMTLEEKVRMCFGGTQPGMSQIVGIPRLGIPSMMASDGPRGVTAASDTAFPSGLALAMSWDPALFHNVGSVIGREARAAGVSVIFAPAINIERDPLGGRFFEYLTEDPYLDGQLAVGMVKGIQEQKVVSCVKHYAANNREENRDWYMSNVDERTLHEIYLPAFRAAVQDGGAWAVMTAANGINGHLAATNEYLIKTTLKKQWGFQGLVLTDFNQARDTLGAAKAGLDVGMPWGNWDDTPFGKPLMTAVQNGLVPQADLDDKARRILRVMDHAGLLSGDDPHAGGSANAADARAIARQAAEESIVLLKNDHNVLPLNANQLHHVIVVGPNATRRQCLGLMGGSSGVQAPYEVTPLEGIKARLAGKAEVEYLDLPEAGSFETIEDRYWKPIEGRHALLAKYYNDGDPKPVLERLEPKIDFTWEMRSPDPSRVHTENFHADFVGDLVPEKTGYYTIRLSGEDNAKFSVDGLPLIEIKTMERVQSQTGTLYLEAAKTYKIHLEYHALAGDASLHLEWSKPTDKAETTNIFEAAATKLRKADAVIVVGGWGHGLDSEGQDRENMDFPSSQQAMIERVSSFNPKTVVVLIHGSPFTMSWLPSVPAVIDAFYPGMEGGTAIAEALFGDINPQGKLTFTWPKRLEDAPSRVLGTQDHENVNYKEGVFIGYRYYDTKSIEPQFPFGYGLSYASYRYGNLHISGNDKQIHLSLTVTNTSLRPGTEIVQIYVSPPQSAVARPSHELKAFARVSLSAGESRAVDMDIDRDSLGYWDDVTHDFVVVPGVYRFAAGTSSRDLLAKGELFIQAKVEK